MDIHNDAELFCTRDYVLVLPVGMFRSEDTEKTFTLQALFDDAPAGKYFYFSYQIDMFNSQRSQKQLLYSNQITFFLLSCTLVVRHKYSSAKRRRCHMSNLCRISHFFN